MEQLNLNFLSADNLLSLGVCGVVSNALTQERERGGPFLSWEDALARLVYNPSQQQEPQPGGDRPYGFAPADVRVLQASACIQKPTHTMCVDTI